jgi:hypothetical protein
MVPPVSSQPTRRPIFPYMIGQHHTPVIAAAIICGLIGSVPAFAGAATEPQTETAQPGSLEEEVRAAELSLVQEGVLLLRPGAWELIPELQYTYSGSEELVIVDPTGVPLIAQQDIRIDRVEMRLGGRIGLPAGFQLDARIPFGFARTRSAIAGVSTAVESWGLGDIELGVSKQIVLESEGIPGLVAGLRWKTATGDTDISGAALGSGTNALQGSILAIRRLDPLVLFGGLAYTENFQGSIAGRTVDPGEQINVRFGTVLATSPETSITVSLDTTFFGKASVDDTPIEGSDGVSSVLELGIGTIISRRTLLSLTAGIGITKSAPDLRLGISLPTRF